LGNMPLCVQAPFLSTVPGFYLAEGLFEDARRMREQIGDAAFFTKLNEVTGGLGGNGGNEGSDSSGWGDMDSGWEASSFDAATLESPNGEERSRLVGDPISKYFSSYRTLHAGGESFVSLDNGLSIMTRPCASLGLRRRYLVPGRACFVAGQPCSRCECCEPRRHQAGETGRSNAPNGRGKN